VFIFKTLNVFRIVFYSL